MIVITSANLRWSKRRSKARSASGGIVYGGEADGSATDVLQRSASGGIVYGGSAFGVIESVFRLASGGIVYGGSANIIEDITIADPTDIANLVNWQDATDASTLYSDTNKTTLAAIDGELAAWEDKSSFGHDSIMGTSSLRPVRKDGYIQFESGNYLTFNWIPSFSTVEAITILAVVADKVGSGQAFYFSNPSFNKVRLYGGNVDAGAEARRTNSGSFTTIQLSYTPSAKMTIRYVADFTGSNSVKLEINSNGQGESGAMIGSGAMTLQGNMSIGDPFTKSFQMYEFIAYNRALSAGEIEAVKAYLQTKHGL